MLALTDVATAAIRSLTTDAELPGGGLRTTAPSPDQGFELSLAGQPGGVPGAGDAAGARRPPRRGADGKEQPRFAIGLQG